MDIFWWGGDIIILPPIDISIHFLFVLSIFILIKFEYSVYIFVSFGKQHMEKSRPWWLLILKLNVETVKNDGLWFNDVVSLNTFSSASHTGDSSLFIHTPSPFMMIHGLVTWRIMYHAVLRDHPECFDLSNSVSDMHDFESGLRQPISSTILFFDCCEKRSLKLNTYIR